MERPRSGQGPDGLRLRRVHMKPGVVIQIVPPGRDASEADEEKRRRIAALTKAQDFFYANAEAILNLRGGKIEDMDELHLNSGKELRSITVDLMDIGLSSADVLGHVQRSLSVDPRLDSVLAFQTVRSYGRLLDSDRELVIQERIDAEAAARAAITKNPQA